ncbi:MAG: hypothetical protein HN929_12705 [Chloroflexi bacterium]|nr:hypothetical protein [Chloroflexota bacterium]
MSDADEAQAGRLSDHCATDIKRQRDADPTLKSFRVSTASFSKAEKNSDDKAVTGLSVKVRVEVEARAKAQGWKVSYDAKSGLTFTPKRKYGKRTDKPAVAEVEKTDADDNSEAA